jgi:hypothetical protein
VEHIVLIAIAIALGVAAVVIGYASVAYLSWALAFGAIALLLASAAVVMLDRSRREPPARVHAPTPPVREPRAQPLQEPPETIAEPVSDTVTVDAETPDVSPSLFPEVVMPEDIDVESVCRAFLASASAAGEAVRAVVWRADGAGDEIAVPLTVSGEEAESLVAGRRSVTSAIESGAAALESLTTGVDGGGTATVWNYVVPFALGEITGAGGVDFLGDRPDLESLESNLRGVPASLSRIPRPRDRSQTSQTPGATLIETARELARLLDPDAVVRASLAKALDLTGGQRAASCSTTSRGSTSAS